MKSSFEKLFCTDKKGRETRTLLLYMNFLYDAKKMYESDLCLW